MSQGLGPFSQIELLTTCRTSIVLLQASPERPLAAKAAPEPAAAAGAGVAGRHLADGEGVSRARSFARACRADVVFGVLSPHGFCGAHLLCLFL